MFCDRCGTRLNDASVYCPSCGKSVRTVPLMPVQGRIAGHVRLLGILWLASAALHLIPAFVLNILFRPHMGLFPTDVPPFLPQLMHFIGIMLLASAVLNLIVGWGLLDRQPWARTLAIVMAVLNLIHPPFGTALGIYTLWVLLPAKSEEEYRRFARVA